jgi:hypothetical protein
LKIKESFLNDSFLKKCERHQGLTGLVEFGEITGKRINYEIAIYKIKNKKKLSIVSRHFENFLIIN